MLTFATILDNPGEPAAETRYRDPRELRALGYSDLIVYPTTGLGGLLGPDTLGSADLRQWVDEQYDAIDQTVAAARRAGLKVWLTCDAPSLAAELVGSAMTCVNQPGVLCPASDELLEMCGQCIEALIGRTDDVEGIVLRLGDTDADKLAYLIGNDIYSPHCGRCGSMGRAERVVRFIRFFHEWIVGRLGRKLIVRAWNVRPGGLHDNAELSRRVVSQLPDDPRLILSFKFTQTDFWRYQQWNPSSLTCGDRPIIYELQCQREFEGKGAVPNYQAPLWRDGMTEVEGAAGLAEVSDRVNLAGLWAWARGGGWGGPYVTAGRETWIDANVYAVPKLAADPKADPDDLARNWVADRLACDGPAAEVMRRILLRSTQTALQTFYIGLYARSRSDPWRPSGSFIQDDQVNAEAARVIVQRLPDEVLDQAVAEKQAAAQRLAEDCRQLSEVAGGMTQPRGEELIHTLDYGEALAQSLHHLLGGLVAYRRQQFHRDPALARTVANAFQAAQTHWKHHQRFANFRGTATAFQSDNLFDMTQKILDDLYADQRSKV